ncbi:MAG TPA: PxKF domain-containing protein, partial [Amnibacterium sp.]|nr:PxKF domain-containing protein [Amnibacterium sp.]
CPDPVTVSANGTNNVSGTVSDVAGNSATASLAIKIDTTGPTLTTANVNIQGGTYTLGAVPAPTCSAKDDLSGLASCTVTLTGGGNASGVGMFTYSATAIDKVGNPTTIPGSYKVIYRWDGFLQPINDTAHQIGTSVSVFKAGSTVPVKFQLKNAAGTVVKAATAPEWLNPVKGTAMSVPVNDSATAASVDSGSAFTYDSSSGQYQYNWKTPSTGGNWYNVGVKLDDGTTQYVTIGLK